MDKKNIHCLIREKIKVASRELELAWQEVLIGHSRVGQRRVAG